MKFEVTNPKAWKAVNEKDMPMTHKIKVYEKLGGAYRLGEDGGEQVFNKMTELLKHKQNEEAETGLDYEVSMSQKQLDGIIKDATELKQKMGEQEFNVAAWVQDHISQASNYINQANTGFSKNESVQLKEEPAKTEGERIQNLNNRIKALRDKISATKSPEQKRLLSDRLKNALQSLSNIRRNH